MMFVVNMILLPCDISTSEQNYIDLKLYSLLIIENIQKITESDKNPYLEINIIQ